MPTAIATERITVPTNRQASEGRDRITVPAASTARAATRRRVVPNRCEVRPTKGEVTANTNSGRVLSTPPSDAVNPVSCSMAGSSVPTPVKVARRLAATKRIAIRRPTERAGVVTGVFGVAIRSAFVAVVRPAREFLEVVTAVVPFRSR
ncbi:hypothetical protein GCM10009548_88080 [Streptomyces malaysiensis subsp. malaysiensis]